MNQNRRDTAFGSTSAMVDGGDLDCGSGLLLMIRSAFEPVEPGGLIEIRSRERSVAEDLPAWCRMVGHELAGSEAASGGYTYFFVRKKGETQEAADLPEDLARAKAYEWRVRVKWTDGLAGKVFARNHEFPVGQPLSFNTEDPCLSALEYLLGALGGCLAMGLALRLRRRGFTVLNLELALRATVDNAMVFLGMEQDGSPAIDHVGGKLYVDAVHDDSELTEVLGREWAETLRCSPVAQSLLRGTTIDVEAMAV
ncbi:MAG: osmotically inducible protein OsmC [Myxococcales bacterium FL481]|nr:MAG: osmotically inducible protein OsmC [Myxococcales bacterium FL481]